jgi:hypothetical protein
MSSARSRWIGVAALAAWGWMAATPARSDCGELITIATHGETTTSYGLVLPPARPPRGKGAVLVLLVGGPGYLKLDERGCPHKLASNSLVRSRELFHKAGLATALVDAPSDHHGDDGLGGFRLSTEHAEDLGKVVADLRQRTKLPVWLVGTSRGALSAANAASFLKGAAAPDGLILTSPVTSGRTGGQKPWIAQTAFDVQLEEIRVPVLLVVHADDTCIRTPPALIGGVMARTNGVRKQTVTMRGIEGSVAAAAPSVEACRGRVAHGFFGQEAEVAEGLARFVRGGRY